MKSTIELPFSEKYDRAHAEQYFKKHQDGMARRLSHWRDEQLARRALRLAGQPNLVLDLPCGAGRFWPLLAEKQNRVIIGADNSADMLAVACASQPKEIVQRVRTLQTSAFAIDLPDNAVDSIFCMRLVHHIADSADRLEMFKEFNRVTRDTVILSLWVDGNFKAWRRKQLEARRQLRNKSTGYQNRIVLNAEQVEHEFVQAGFSVEKHLDFLPHYSMWRVYILRKV
ncbi:class I SAM-dependent methyltransferase [Pseudomonas sp. MAG002Y]|uniref:class I SAM-dependent methyltransferase n=1 Tax=Pseudomonas sp. MAG002Y TaxID=2678690 RepID=UPI001C60F7C5|nr:class I SAM-dependent methyltransferase [Pseudomonas sp. MAG002Y]MBW5414271.1 methyltransferase domain-containing protein [Pseudomonas sp. MAG002Y]